MPALQQSNFHSLITTNFGRSALNHLRKAERKTIALAKWKNHLHFSLSCKRYSVFPVSLSVTCPVKGARADAILHRTKKALLREQIRQTVMVIDNIKKDVSAAKANFITAVDAETLQEANRRLTLTEHAIFSKTREKQKAKLDCLLSSQNPSATESRLVTNVDKKEEE